LIAGCGSPVSPAAPSPVGLSGPQAITLEAEAGGGDGDLMHRSRASGAMTIHLAPDQRRRWTFQLSAEPSQYEVLLTYSNDNPGATEVLRAEIDGEILGALQTQDTGDDGEGWNVFVAEPAGLVRLSRGTHTLTVESSGGDGCIEIDMVSLRPVG
jgi:hypothetical protein